MSSSLTLQCLCRRHVKACLASSMRVAGSTCAVCIDEKLSISQLAVSTVRLLLYLIELGQRGNTLTDALTLWLLRLLCRGSQFFPMSP